MTLHVVVIGAGIIGATTAYELAKSGCRVTIIDPAIPGEPQAASYGNGAWISPASIIPMSMPGIWRKIPGYLLDKNSPLTIKWKSLPHLLPWLVKFMAAGATIPKVKKTAKALNSILQDAPQRHLQLAANLARPDLINQSGVIYAYPDRAAFEAEALAWRLRKDNGLEWEELDEKSLRKNEPALSAHYKFGVLVKAGAHSSNPGEYVWQIFQQAMKHGAEFRQAATTGFDIVNGRLRSILTDSGVIACDRAVICAGIWSKELAKNAGDQIPLESERGYHCVIRNAKSSPLLPIMPSDGKMANTPTTSGLRIAGQVELAHLNTAPNWNRVEVLIRHALSTYPELGKRENLQTEYWMGHRPSTSDGLPVISEASNSQDIIYAFGHGHIGLASGPITARIAADLAMNKAPPINIEPFSVKRFGKKSMG